MTFVVILFPHCTITLPCHCHHCLSGVLKYTAVTNESGCHIAVSDMAPGFCVRDEWWEGWDGGDAKLMLSMHRHKRDGGKDWGLYKYNTNMCTYVMTALKHLRRTPNTQRMEYASTRMHYSMFPQTKWPPCHINNDLKTLSLTHDQTFHHWKKNTKHKNACTSCRHLKK